MTSSLSVLKFGGTSVKNIARFQHVAQIVKARLTRGPVIVVVSAMGDTTDYLVKLANQSSAPLTSQAISNPDKREMDVLLSTGEQISIALLSMALHSIGVKAKSFTGYQVGIFTESVHSKARIVDLKTDSLSKALTDHEVLVVAGFQGMTEAGDVTTLGRGGSDTTAVALAAAMNAKICDIYTDVDGVFTADPNSIPSAKLLHSISYEEVLEMARLGAQVIHPRAVELARQYKVNLRVRNTFKPEHEGTLIHGGGDLEIYRTVSGVAIDREQVRCSIMDVPDVPGTAGKIMRALADKNIVIDMIMQAVHPSQGLNNVTFTVHESELDETIMTLHELKGKLSTGEVLFDNDIAKVSLIGASMVGQPGIAATLFEALGQEKINIKMITTSEMKLTCVVGRADALKAASLIHDAFGLDKVTA
jgi:aspartate kinase